MVSDFGEKAQLSATPGVVAEVFIDGKRFATPVVALGGRGDCFLVSPGPQQSVLLLPFVPGLLASPV